MVEVELVARAVRILVNRLFKDNKEICDSPAATIASVLSHVLATGATTSKAAPAAGLPTPPSASTGGGGGGKKGKKKKNKSGNGSSNSDDTVGSSGAKFLPPTPLNAASDSTSTLEALDAILQGRFLYSLADVRATKEEDAKSKDIDKKEEEKEKEKEKEDAGPLGARIPHYAASSHL